MRYTRVGGLPAKFEAGSADEAVENIQDHIEDLIRVACGVQ